MKEKRLQLKQEGITSFTLHLIAIFLMTCDHLWATLLYQYDFLTLIGRIAFPIFAFMLVEGYHHTHHIKGYIRRLFLFALISELPFNLMCNGYWLYPFHQNVLWCFLFSIIGIHLIEKAKSKKNIGCTTLVSVLVVSICYVLGYLLMTDYYGPGMLTVFAFYFFRGQSWPKRVGQCLCLLYINWHLLGGLIFEIPMGSFVLDFPQQAFALLALPLIWCYKGKQGYYSRSVKAFYYWFYPVHALILGIATYIF